MLKDAYEAGDANQTLKQRIAWVFQYEIKANEVDGSEVSYIDTKH